ncbi:MAG: TatD family hydrolase [Bacteroidales bacterium]|nr:TatD family hydrolase [Bacteroidales bacterium]
MTFPELADFHTHQTGKSDALLSLTPQEALAGCATPYSLSLHPWHVSDSMMTDFRLALERCQADPLFLAIGESGLDNQCDTPLEQQLAAFRLSLTSARELHKPVIVHCVGYWNEMIREVSAIFGKPGKKNLPFNPLCLIHGFRKGPQLAKQLLDAGYCLSLGEKFNPDVARQIPDEWLFFETDESKEDIWKIREKIVNLRAENR